MISGWVAPPSPLLPPLLRCSQPIISPSPAQTASPRCSCSAVPDVSASSCYSLGFVFVFFHLCVFGVKLELLCFFFSCVLRRPASTAVMHVFIHRSTFVQSGATYKWVSAFTCTATSALDSALRLDGLLWLFASSVLLTATKRLQVV